MKRITLLFLTAFLGVAQYLPAKQLLNNIPCTLEINSENTQGAKHFYQGVFDWKFESYKVSGDKAWTCLRLASDSVSVDRGIPESPVSIWKSNPGEPFRLLMYIKVSSIDTCLKRIKECGGSIFEDKTPIGSERFKGFYAICKDIDGNYFGLWQNDVAHSPVTPQAKTFCPVPCSFEVTGKDGVKLKKFYGKVFDWDFAEDKDNAGFYLPAKHSGRNVAGLIEAPILVYTELPELGEPTGVMIYIKVKSLENHLSRVTKLGGSVLKGKTHFKGLEYEGYYALCKDVDGNNFGIWELGKTHAS